MKIEDVGYCAVDSLLTVIWWWIWYGIVAAVLGEGWGFLIVLFVVFAAKMYKKSNSCPAVSMQATQKGSE